MIKQIAWNTFKNTGDINTYMELVEVENIEKKLNSMKQLNDDTKVSNYGELKNKGDNIS